MVGYNTSNKEVVCFSHKTKLFSHSPSSHNSILSACVKSGYEHLNSKYYKDNSYNSNKLYEIKEYSNESGDDYFNIYGELIKRTNIKIEDFFLII